MPATLLITESDRPVPPSAGRWLEGEICTIQESTHTWGSGELDLNKFLRFTVTDKTPAEMNAYLQQWNRLIDMSVISGGPGDDDRTINVRNNRVNQSGDMGEWTVSNTEAIRDEWNLLYPTCNLVIDSIFTDAAPNDVFQCTGFFTVGQAVEFEATIIEKGLADLLKRKIWYITSAGMTNIRNAGGSQSGTAAQLNPILRDGLLD
jgi:hypothetical protein